MFILLKSSRRRFKLAHFILSLNILLALVLEMCVFGVNAASKMANLDKYEDDFVEFDEFEKDDEDRKSDLKNTVPLQSSEEVNKAKLNDASASDEGDVIVEDEEEFEEEFENPDYVEEKKSSGSKPAKLKITKVPLHLRSTWESYYLEFLMTAGLVVYFLNFITGRNKNQRLANAWLNAHKDLLDGNFALVGDDGKKEIETHGLMKETENVFTLWCSGRVCVEGMLVELRFLKRQDLVNIISNMIKPATDQIIVKVHLNPDAMDTFVFCLANKKSAVKLVKEMNDLSIYCPERKSPEKYGVSAESFVLMNEIGEAATVLLDSRVVSVIKKYEKYIDFIQISDQFSGPKIPEETQLIKLPDVKKVMIFGFNVALNDSSKNEDEAMENYKPLMQLVFYLLEKVRKLRLSKEGKTKADKNRQKVEEIFLKATHAQRQEAAQAKREERRRAEKEKILNEEDPDKQRKWEEREYRRELKKKAPKMKQLKVKAI